MTLEDFAKDAGVTLFRCDPEWGGTWGYKSEDYPNTSYCGFRSANAAYKGWAEGTFGKRSTKALLKLFKNVK